MSFGYSRASRIADVTLFIERGVWVSSGKPVGSFDTQFCLRVLTRGVSGCLLETLWGVFDTQFYLMALATGVSRCLLYKLWLGEYTTFSTQIYIRNPFRMNNLDT